jgi:hypothetical protein
MQYYEAAHKLSTIFFCPTVEMQLGFHVAFSQIINVFFVNYVLVYGTLPDCDCAVLLRSKLHCFSSLQLSERSCNQHFIT